ncbi:hypothetical protein ZIOFF_047041 [Zingiber officinale]|uniref:Uncharacterized protein n=1 Tax=Zingiber officinale TaxID=94328 RepID=A0A8J5KJJ7_ZINOF|nr:hypothetical protein ZIOFF_047041 [Zingiber officinale]
MSAPTSGRFFLVIGVAGFVGMQACGYHPRALLLRHPQPRQLQRLLRSRPEAGMPDATRLCGYLHRLGQHQLRRTAPQAVRCVSILEQLLKVKAVKKFVKMPGNSDVQFTHANITLTEEELGYHPTTSLHSGLKKFVRWYLGLLKFLSLNLVVYNHYGVEGLKGQIPPPGAGVPRGATFFSSGGDGPTPFRFNPRDTGTIVTMEEMLTIDLEPRWKKGTKNTFPAKGNESPNVVPADTCECKTQIFVLWVRL